VRLDRFYGFETRILDVDQRITGLQTDIAAALQANRQHLQQVALTVIEQHQLQLDRMRAKALLSIARLQDRGYVQDRERQAASTVRQPVTVDLESGDAQTVPATEDGGIRTTADMPVEEKPAAKSLSEVIKRIFED
jgi:DNA-binding transcriptional MocR family regulator